MIIDTHAHYDDEAFDGDRDALIRSLEGGGVEAVVDVGAGRDSSEAAVRLAEQYERVYAAVGTHPDNAGELTEADMERYAQLAAHPKVVAIGEIGLDYHWRVAPEEVQKRWFARQIALARETGLPVIVHSRDAAKDTMDVIRAERPGETGGVLHCYSYEAEQAREYWRMGLYIGVGGVVTFKNARKLKEVAEALPLEALVLETDCPYLAPSPHRGERNSSLYLPLVAEALARIKGVTPEEVVETTRENALRLYPKLGAALRGARAEGDPQAGTLSAGLSAGA